MRILFSVIIFFITAKALGQVENKKLLFSPLTINFYIYTTFGDPGDGVLFPANGMYLVTGKGVILFDAPWDTTQFQPLLDSIYNRHQQKVIMCIATHFHADRTGGLQYYKQKGIKTYTTQQTDDLSQQHNEPRAQYLLKNDTVFHIGGYSFQTYYPGKGHSPDNIVIWFPRQKILYGGCFIKSIETDNPGNLSDADIDEWIHSIKKVQAKFLNPAFIITGHQDWKSKAALSHTLEILENYKKKTGIH